MGRGGLRLSPLIMAINLDNGNEYFQAGRHSDSPIWNAFLEEDRQGAIIEAIEFLSSYRARGKKCPYGKTVAGGRLCTEKTKTGDFPREDVAVYEQALHFLKFGVAVPDSSLTGAHWIAQNINDLRESGTKRDMLSKRAMRYMNWSVTAGRG